MQLKEEGFRELVSGRGCSYEHGGPASPKLACKLKALKQDMKQWNREVFDNIATCKACALDSIRAGHKIFSYSKNAASWL